MTQENAQWRNGEQTTTSSTSNPEKAFYVWDKMKGIFGNGFTSSFGEIPSQLWIESMSALSEKDINAGLNKVLRGGYDFAPNLSKFLKLCTPETVEDVYKTERETYLMLENRKTIQSSAEVRKAEIAKMKAELRGVSA
jgi:hypothetical protein